MGCINFIQNLQSESNHLRLLTSAMAYLNYMIIAILVLVWEKGQLYKMKQYLDC